MCFIIDEKARTPGNRIAWKIVAIDSQGELQSLYYRDGEAWYPDETHSLGSYAVTSCAVTRYINKAYMGYYVYLSKRAAKQVLRQMTLCVYDYEAVHKLVLLRMEVSSEDFLFRGKGSDSTITTYKKVKVSKHQPEIEFY